MLCFQGKDVNDLISWRSFISLQLENLLRDNAILRLTPNLCFIILSLFSKSRKRFIYLNSFDKNDFKKAIFSVGLTNTSIFLKTIKFSKANN